MPVHALLLAQIVSGQVPLDSHDVTIISLSVAAALVVLVVLIGVMHALSRKPPIEVEIDRRIAIASNELRTEMLRLNAERRAGQRILFDKYEALVSTTEEGFKDIHRSLGKIEGLLEAKS